MVVASAEAAVKHAIAVREQHAKRSSKSSERRKADLRVAQTRLQRAMKPIRSELARIARLPTTSESNTQYTRLATASKALQRERRKLWKMQPRKRKRVR